MFQWRLYERTGHLSAVQRNGPDLRVAFGRLLVVGRAFLFRRAAIAGERVCDEGVGAAFLAEGRGRAVARHESDIVAQWPELAGDGVDQLLVVAARKIGAAD